jgi:hypothetical protein
MKIYCTLQINFAEIRLKKLHPNLCCEVHFCTFFELLSGYFCCIRLTEKYAVNVLHIVVSVLINSGNDQLDALFLNVFILCLCMFQASKCSSSGGTRVSS